MTDMPYSELVALFAGRLPTGELALRHTAVIPASQAEIWNAFTTTEGLRSFVAPVIDLDFRIGGRWESSYNPQSKIGDPANIANEVMCYLPPEMLAIRNIQTPPGFPDPELGKRLWTVMQFEARGDRETKVTITMLGWADGDEASPVFELFRRGNVYTLGKLYERFRSGPHVWD